MWWCVVVFVCVVFGGVVFCFGVFVCRLFRDILIVYEHILVSHAFAENQLHRLHLLDIFSLCVWHQSFSDIPNRRKNFKVGPFAMKILKRIE